jgi:hypothetical protein
MLDLDAIKARWQDVRWTYGTTRLSTAYLQTHYGDIAVDEDLEEANALLLASHAPADVQALLGEVDRLCAALHAYGAHTPECAERLGLGGCNCGLDTALIRAAAAPAPAPPPATPGPRPQGPNPAVH